jgi:predicted aspartyl protease
LSEKVKTNEKEAFMEKSENIKNLLISIDSCKKLKFSINKGQNIISKNITVKGIEPPSPLIYIRLKVLYH